MKDTIMLSEVVDIKGGGTPSRSNPAFWGGGIPWATVKDFKSIDLARTQESITEDGLLHSATNVIRAGAVVIPTRMALGKAAINSVDIAINQDLKALLPKRGYHNRFLLHFLLSKANYLEKKGKGATVKGITLDVLRSLEIPRLPEPEQRRIAAILDKADGIRRKRGQEQALADDFLRSAFLQIFGDPVTNPKGLHTLPLSELASFVSGATPSKARKDFWSGTFPWVSPKDMKRLVIDDAQDHVSEMVFSETNLKRIPRHTVLIVVRGMILAHTVPIAITGAEVTINQDIKAVFFDKAIDPLFGLWCLKVQHGHLLSKIDTAAHGTKRFDMDRLGSVPITVPDGASQRRFVSLARSFSSLRSDLSSATVLEDLLSGSLIQDAFSPPNMEAMCE